MKTAKQLVEHISGHTYTHVHQVVSHIFEHWAIRYIRYTVSGLNKWLYEKGFTYKNLQGAPNKVNATGQAEFIEQYKELKALTPED